MRINRLGLIVATLTLVACGGNTSLPVAAGTGPTPELPPVRKSLLPTVHVAPVARWKNGAKPVAADGLTVNAFATGLDHPRWLYVLPNGDVLVAESNAQTRKPKGIYQRIQKSVMNRAGAGVDSADRITLLRDKDGDGVAEINTVFLSDLTSPFGMSLIGNRLYVANTDGVVSFPYTTGATAITASATPLISLPAGELNHHWTKGLIASADGQFLFAAIGSNSDHGENGMDMEAGRAAIWRIDVATGSHRIYASGLRNPVGMALEPATGALWTTVNERDELGGDLVPDYMTAVADGGFYGWPYYYFGDHPDPRVKQTQRVMLPPVLTPDYALGAHTGSLGLSFADGAKLGPQWQAGAFVGQHGSWNRKPRSGYKVIYVPFASGKPNGLPVNVLTGFLDDDGNAQGRPVGVTIDQSGALLVADDVGNIVWRVVQAQE